MSHIDLFLGDFAVINDEPDAPQIKYGVAIEVNGDVIALWLKNLFDTYDEVAAMLILSGAEVVTSCGDRIRYLGPFQDTGEGDFHHVGAFH